MVRYNYFDDDPEELESSNRRININFDIRDIFYGAKERIDDIIHGNAIEDFKEIRELPNLKALFLKLLAFIMFLVFVLIIVVTFSHSISTQNKKLEQFKTDAGKVCTKYITDYGSVKWESLDRSVYGKDMTRLTGLCYARQMDFDRDGNAELMLCYNDGSVYKLEVWGYVDKEFAQLYSDEANSTDNIKDGSWIGFYYKNNKYYICKSEKDTPQSVDLLALKGDKFKKVSSCDYDHKDNIYSVKGKINADDFETIKLSCIKTAKADSIVDIATANMDGFGTVSMAVINSHKSEAQLKADAYYRIIEDRHNKYGKAVVASEGKDKFIEGVALVKLVDFDNDDSKELLIVYRKMVKESATNYYSGERITIENPTYCMEVYKWNGTVAKKIFTKNSICNYLENRDVNYIMLKHNDNKTTDICMNTYNYHTGYSYTANSRIYKLKKDSFETAFNARLDDEYGYREYYLDGEYTYSSTFADRGYEVPKFMNDGQKVDEKKYELIYFSGTNSGGYSSVVDNTVKEIQKLNKSYSPND